MLPLHGGPTRHGFADACNALQGLSSAKRTSQCAGTWSLRGILSVARGNISNVAGLSAAHMACSQETFRAAVAMVHAEHDWQI